MNHADVKKHTRESMNVLKIDDPAASSTYGKEFYKFMFQKAPNLRQFFKGAENITSEEVETSERFAKQGLRQMTAIHVLAACYDDQPTFLAYTRELANRHVNYNVPDATFEEFFPIWIEYLSSKGLTSEAKTAWTQLGKTFTEEFRKQLKSH
uniref:GLOBIN domain-containing protein n=1 Tax=Parastrongyloides trichosuri TaxID=131310 RepID=A0A0N4ZHV7_PARTI